MRRFFSAFGIAATLVALPAQPAKTDAGDNFFQVVVDVTPSIEGGLKPGFGYGVYVQYEGKRILFDTGIDAALLRDNLAMSGIDPGKLDVVAISHNHPDHMGGLGFIRKARPDITILVPPGQKYDGGKLAVVEDQIQLAPNIYVLRTHTDVPTVGIYDELSLLLVTSEGPYLLTACSHTGVAAIVDKAARIAGRDIFFYTGGARLKFRGEDDARQVAGELKQRRVTHVSPGHCSVDHNVARIFEEAFPQGYIASRLGQRVLLKPLSGVN